MTISTQWIIMLSIAYWLASIGAFQVFITWDNNRLKESGEEPASQALTVFGFVLAPCLTGFALLMMPLLGIVTVMHWLIKATGRPRLLADDKWSFPSP